MTILQIMKLLHHSQGYSQCTFIQKYRLSHISHSGLNRHWSIRWALQIRVEIPAKEVASWGGSPRDLGGHRRQGPVRPPQGKTQAYSGRLSIRHQRAPRRRRSHVLCPDRAGAERPSHIGTLREQGPVSSLCFTGRRVLLQASRSHLLKFTKENWKKGF